MRDVGTPVIRGVGMFNWKDKSISVLGSIHEGDKVRFTLPPDFEVIEEVKFNAEKIQQNEMPVADALLMFSCIGRLGQFGPLISEEIEGIKNVFNVPMAGFFTYGEFGKTNQGNNEFHNSTCCWVALKEE
jgi:small ligand-binding sensory domain FIST